MKRKLDKKALQAFFVDHGEKVLYGVVVLCALALIFLALSEKGYDKKPSDLTASIDNANHTIDATKPEPLPGCDAPDLTVASGEIHADAYAFGTRLMGTLIMKRKTRDMPKLCAVESLRAASGVGAFTIAVAARTPAAPAPRHGARAAPQHIDTGMRGEHFIVVTGLVPIEKERDAYTRCFEKAQVRDPARDVPVYVGYFIERAEVSGDSLPERPQWSPLAFMNEPQMAKEAKKRWTSAGGEVVSSQYLDKALTCPLPPRKDRNWGSEVAHDPEIPLPSQERAATGEHAGEQTMQNQAVTPDNDPFGQKNPMNNQHGPMPVPHDMQQEKRTAYYLLRYFDFDVKPGHKYVYRVFPVVKNPNRDLPATALTSPDDASKLFIGDAGSTATNFAIDHDHEECWSMTAEMVAVPEEVQVLAQAVKLAPRAEEPAADIRTVTWLEEKGILAPMTQSDLHRGRLLDFPGCTYREETTTTAVHGPRKLPPGTPIDYLTGQILVDMSPSRNGDGITQPGEVLVLRKDGKMEVHDVVEDQVIFDRLQTPKDQRLTQPGPGPGPMPIQPTPSGFDPNIFGAPAPHGHH